MALSARKGDYWANNISIQEYPWDEDQNPKRDLVKEPLKREGGYLMVPDAPGIGIELNEEGVRTLSPGALRTPAADCPGRRPQRLLSIEPTQNPVQLLTMANN